MSVVETPFRHPANGVIFPNLFMVSGNYCTHIKGKIGEVAPPCYILSDSDNPEGSQSGLIVSAVDRINTLNPEAGPGTLIIRHHRSEAAAEGYFDALCDLDHLYSLQQCRTDHGIFTILQRLAAAGQPDNLIAYLTEVGDLNDLDDFDVRYHIVHPNGATTSNDDLLFPLAA